MSQVAIIDYGMGTCARCGQADPSTSPPLPPSSSPAADPAGSAVGGIASSSPAGRDARLHAPELDAPRNLRPAVLEAAPGTKMFSWASVGQQMLFRSQRKGQRPASASSGQAAFSCPTRWWLPMAPPEGAAWSTGTKETAIQAPLWARHRRPFHRFVRSYYVDPATRLRWSDVPRHRLPRGGGRKARYLRRAVPEECPGGSAAVLELHRLGTAAANPVVPFIPGDPAAWTSLRSTIDQDGAACVCKPEMDAATVFSEDPRMARQVGRGRRLHLVDLNGAFAVKPKSRVRHQGHPRRSRRRDPRPAGRRHPRPSNIERYLGRRPHLRDHRHRGGQEPRASCTTPAGLPQPHHRRPDAKGRHATDGWSKVTGHDVVIWPKFEDYGVEGVIYTDIAATACSPA